MSAKGYSRRDREFAAQLMDSLGQKPSDTEFRSLWRVLFARGLVDSITPPSEYEFADTPF